MKHRGFTILETVLVMSILSGLMLLVTIFFSRARHYTSETETYSRVQRQANICIRKLADAFYSASRKYTQYYGNSVIFLSSDPVQSTDPRLEFDPLTGKIMWKKWMLFAHDAAKEEVYSEQVPLDSPTAELLNLPAPDVDLPYFASNALATRRIVARNVKDFNVQGTGVSFIVTVTCEDSAPVPGRTDNDKIVEVSVTSEISLLN